MSDWDSSSNVVGELPEELWALTYLTNLYDFLNFYLCISSNLWRNLQIFFFFKMCLMCMMRLML